MLMEVTRTHCCGKKVEGAAVEKMKSRKPGLALVETDALRDGKIGEGEK